MRNLLFAITVGILFPIVTATSAKAGYEDESLEMTMNQSCSRPSDCSRGEWCDTGKCKPGCDEASDCQQFSGAWGNQQTCNMNTHRCDMY